MPIANDFAFPWLLLVVFISFIPSTIFCKNNLSVIAHFQIIFRDFTIKMKNRNIYFFPSLRWKQTSISKRKRDGKMCKSIYVDPSNKKTWAYVFSFYRSQHFIYLCSTKVIQMCLTIHKPPTSTTEMIWSWPLHHNLHFTVIHSKQIHK